MMNGMNKALVLGHCCILKCLLCYLILVVIVQATTSSSRSPYTTPKITSATISSSSLSISDRSIMQETGAKIHDTIIFNKRHLKEKERKTTDMKDSKNNNDKEISSSSKNNNKNDENDKKIVNNDDNNIKHYNSNNNNKEISMDLKYNNNNNFDKMIANNEEKKTELVAVGESKKIMDIASDYDKMEPYTSSINTNSAVNTKIEINDNNDNNDISEDESTTLSSTPSNDNKLTDGSATTTTSINDNDNNINDVGTSATTTIINPNNININNDASTISTIKKNQMILPIPTFEISLLITTNNNNDDEKNYEKQKQLLKEIIEGYLLQEYQNYINNELLLQQLQSSVTVKEVSLNYILERRRGMLRSLNNINDHHHHRKMFATIEDIKYGIGNSNQQSNINDITNKQKSNIKVIQVYDDDDNYDNGDYENEENSIENTLENDNVVSSSTATSNMNQEKSSATTTSENSNTIDNNNIDQNNDEEVKEINISDNNNNYESVNINAEEMENTNSEIIGNNNDSDNNIEEENDVNEDGPSATNANDAAIIQPIQDTNNVNIISKYYSMYGFVTIQTQQNNSNAILTKSNMNDITDVSFHDTNFILNIMSSLKKYQDQEQSEDISIVTMSIKLKDDDVDLNFKPNSIKQSNSGLDIIVIVAISSIICITLVLSICFILYKKYYHHDKFAHANSRISKKKHRLSQFKRDEKLTHLKAAISFKCYEPEEKKIPMNVIQKNDTFSYESNDEYNDIEKSSSPTTANNKHDNDAATSYDDYTLPSQWQDNLANTTSTNYNNNNKNKIQSLPSSSDNANISCFDDDDTFSIAADSVVQPSYRNMRTNTTTRVDELTPKVNNFKSSFRSTTSSSLNSISINSGNNKSNHNNNNNSVQKNDGFKILSSNKTDNKTNAKTDNSNQPAFNQLWTNVVNEDRTIV